MALNIDAKFEGKLNGRSKSGMRKSANFHQSMFECLKVGTFVGSFYPKQKMYELEIYRRVMCHDNEKLCTI